MENAEVVRSEERLVVQHQTTATGRVRFGKRVVTEERTVTVTVRREEFFIKELPPPTTPTVSDPATSSAPESVVIVLSEEEPVVSTRVVPREAVTVTIERRARARTSPLSSPARRST